jgi:hypothetical protein
VPPTATGAVPDLDYYLRRCVWVVAAIVVIAAAIMYAGKAAEERSAFIRWRHQVLEFWGGVNIYDEMMFPNPPILPLTLLPLMVLPPLVGAMSWFALKTALTVVSIAICFRMVQHAGRPLASWFQAGVLLFTSRPILSDLQHGNNNLLILFLIVAALESWRRGYDVLAGLVLALSITFKVTPLLFVPYFVYKRSWRTVGATFLGIGIFLLIVPSLIIGPRFNGECLGMWWHRILGPYVAHGVVGAQEINQSMVGVLTRLLTATKVGTGRYDSLMAVNVVAWDPNFVNLLVKGISLGLVGLLAVFCRTPARRRDDPRLLGEFALIVLTMLFVSERSWKHHYVTLLLPYTYLMGQFAFSAQGVRPRAVLLAAMWGSVLLMATTSSELGGLVADGQGHKIAQAYGMFLWAGAVLYAATAWRVRVEARRPPSAKPVAASSRPGYDRRAPRVWFKAPGAIST